MRSNAIAGGLVAIAAMLIWNRAEGAAVPILVSATSNDELGRQLVYFLKQDIVRSAEFKLVYTMGQASYVIGIVSIPSYKNGDTEWSTAYSGVLIGSSGFFFTQEVGVCGRNNIRSCAATLLADFGYLIDKGR